jgi:hypothetical protein
MTDQRLHEITAGYVRAILEPWLQLHYGPRCDEFEFGCECCIRWKMTDELLAIDRIGTPEDLKKEIETLRECLRWREELFERLSDNKKEC